MPTFRKLRRSPKSSLSVDVDWENRVYKGSRYDSDEEIYFAFWCDELLEHGYLKKWMRNRKTYTLTEGLNHHWVKETVLKTKIKVEDKVQKLLLDSCYTPDFVLYWTAKAKNVFFQSLTGHHNQITAPFIAKKTKDAPATWKSVVEVKPDFDRFNMTRAFVMNQKFMWYKWKIFVSLVEYKDLFSKTFTPQRYLKTKTGKIRKLNWVKTSILQFTQHGRTKNRIERPASVA